MYSRNFSAASIAKWALAIVAMIAIFAVAMAYIGAHALPSPRKDCNQAGGSYYNGYCHVKEANE